MEKETITLFKYHKFNTELIQLLTLNSFYCASRNQLNDPYDMHFKLSEEYLRKIICGLPMLSDFEKIYNSFCHKLRNGINIEELTKLHDEDKIKLILSNEFNSMLFVDELIEYRKYKVICFTGEYKKKKKNNNSTEIKQVDQEILMWAHYAKFDGVRLTFNLPKNFKIDAFTDFTIESVKYKKKKSTISSNEDIYKLLHTKDKNWKYENEYRIILPIFSTIKFEKNSLKEITFGSNLHIKSRQMLVRIVKSLYPTIIISELVHTNDGFIIKPIEEIFINQMLSLKPVFPSICMESH